MFSFLNSIVFLWLWTKVSGILLLNNFDKVLQSFCVESLLNAMRFFNQFSSGFF